MVTNFRSIFGLMSSSLLKNDNAIVAKATPPMPLLTGHFTKATQLQNT